MADAWNKRALYTLAYPTFVGDDARRIDEIRRHWDPQHGRVTTHFTLVFACSALGDDVYLSHVEAVCRVTAPITFRCRYAMLPVADAVGRVGVFLVPDEGFSGLSRLHDALYKGLLAPHLRFDSAFVPHMTLASVSDRSLAKRICDDLNQGDLLVRGTIERLTVEALEGMEMRTLGSFRLEASR
jgi:2'-5' RNA ligase